MTEETPKHTEEWLRTRRHVLAMCGILSGSLLAACRLDTTDPLKIDLQKHEIFKFLFDPKHKHKKHTHAALNDAREPSCYLEGTRILTPRGSRRIETLRVGNLLETGSGQRERIEWIARAKFIRPPGEDWPDHVRPVRIRKGAFWPNIPSSDLLVSQNHRLYLGGMLIRAADLVNGCSIVIEPASNCDTLEYFHIKTNGHKIIFANKVPSETLLFEDIEGALFDNAAEFWDIFDGVPESTSTPCAPVYAECGRRQQLHSHLRSAISPWIDIRNPFEVIRDTLEAERSLLPIAPPPRRHEALAYPSLH